MKTIIVPIDFSEISINAARYAAGMALAVNVNLILFHSTKDETGQDETKIKAEQLICELLQQTANKILVRYNLVTGFIEDELLQMCNKVNPMAVVMATHGENRKGNLFFDSATVYFSRNLGYPVINVPKDAKFQTIQKILLATDGENIDTITVKKVIEIVQAFQASVDIIHVYQNENALEKRQPIIEEWIRHLKGVNGCVYYIRHNNVYDAITGFAKANESQLLLTFPGKHSMFHKSESKKLLFNAPVATMTIQ